MALGGGNISISTSPQTIHALLSLVSRQYYSQLTIKAFDDNVGNVFVGKSGVSSSAYIVRLTPGSSYTWGPFSHRPLNSEEVYIVGSSGDDVEINTVE